MCLLTICMSSLEKCLFRAPAHFWFFFFLCWAIWAICIIWRLIPLKPDYSCAKKQYLFLHKTSLSQRWIVRFIYCTQYPCDNTQYHSWNYASSTERFEESWSNLIYLFISSIPSSIVSGTKDLIPQKGRRKKERKSLKGKKKNALYNLIEMHEDVASEKHLWWD